MASIWRARAIQRAAISVISWRPTGARLAWSWRRPAAHHARTYVRMAEPAYRHGARLADLGAGWRLPGGQTVRWWRPLARSLPPPGVMGMAVRRQNSGAEPQADVTTSGHPLAVRRRPMAPVCGVMAESWRAGGGMRWGHAGGAMTPTSRARAVERGDISVISWRPAGAVVAPVSRPSCPGVFGMAQLAYRRWRSAAGLCAGWRPGRQAVRRWRRIGGPWCWMRSSWRHSTRAQVPVRSEETIPAVAGIGDPGRAPRPKTPTQPLAVKPHAADAKAAAERRRNQRHPQSESRKAKTHSGVRRPVWRYPIKGKISRC